MTERSAGLDGFDELSARLTYPVYVVTAAAGDEHEGCLVGFATQCGIDPVRTLICLSNKNRTTRIAGKATHLGVNVLADENRDIAELFGGETGDDVNKLSWCRWRPGPGGAPILTSAAAYYIGLILDRVTLGDHVGHLVEPVDSWCRPEAFDYVDFAAVRDLDPGHEA